MKFLWQKVRELSKRVSGLEHRLVGIEAVARCSHEWKYCGFIHRFNGMIFLFMCQRCQHHQERPWSGLTEQEIQGLELLGIHKPETKTGKGQ